MVKDASMLDLLIGFVIGLTVATWTADCRAEEWNGTDKALFGAFIGLQVVDALQTYEIEKHPDKWQELNPIIGDPPQWEKVVALKALEVGIVYYLLDKHSTPKQRRGALWFLDGIYLGIVASNHYSAGIRIRF